MSATFVPKGEMSVGYDVCGEGGSRYFVKIAHVGEFEDTARALTFSAELYEAGYRHAVAPIRATDGSVVTRFEGVSLAVVEHLGVESVWDRGATEDDYCAAAPMIAALHGMTDRVDTTA
ncbi:MAG: hypothetical protein O3A46_07085, partial [Candidatus Poribacteria bacterium]|nr:hypothetical protein [Candidatus Poribacteria bacterium]